MSLVLAADVDYRPPVSLDSLLAIGIGLASAPSSLALPLDPVGSARAYSRLLATDAYEAWLLAWPPGSAIAPHDHGASHGVFVVVSGALMETRYDNRARQRRVLGPGEAAVVPVGVVHDVSARGPVAALSVHVYSPRLNEMRFFDESGQVVAVEPLAEEAPERAGHREGRRPSSALRTALLVLLAERPDHGYDLAPRLSGLGVVADRAAVYRTLRTMERRGELRSGWCASDHGPARRVYEVTATGRSALAAAFDGMTAHGAAVEQVLHRAGALPPS